MNERVRTLIGPGVPGPARVSYLPRLWHRSCLRRLDLLGPDSADYEAPFEEAIAALAGSDALATLADDVPTYVQFETRFLQTAGQLADERMAAHNETIATLQYGDAEAKKLRSSIELDSAQEQNARLLIDLDTWSYLHNINVDGAARGNTSPADVGQGLADRNRAHTPGL
jgi:hypothetical protein